MAIPRATEGHLLRFPSLDFEGRCEYLQFLFWSRYDRGTELIFFPENTTPVYVDDAKELLGEDLYLRLMQSKLFDTSKPGPAGIDVPDDLVDALVQRLNDHFADKPVCESCFTALTLEGTRTCTYHRGALSDNTAKDLGRYAEMSFDDIATRILERLWPRDAQPTMEELFDSVGIFRQIMLLQEVIGEFLPQTRWQELIDEVDITDDERTATQRMTQATGSVVHAAHHGRLGRAREAYTRMIVIVVLRKLNHWPPITFYA